MPFKTRDLNNIRREMERWMIDRCRITRPGVPTFNPATGIKTAATDVIVYEGKCRITPGAGGQEALLGEEIVTWRDTDIYIPWNDVVPERDDLVELLESHDEATEARVWRVTGVSFATHRVSRRLSCTSLEPGSNTDQL